MQRLNCRLINFIFLQSIFHGNNWRLSDDFVCLLICDITYSFKSWSMVHNIFYPTSGQIQVLNS